MTGEEKVKKIWKVWLNSLKDNSILINVEDNYEYAFAFLLLSKLKTSDENFLEYLIKHNHNWQYDTDFYHILARFEDECFYPFVVFKKDKIIIGFEKRLLINQNYVKKSYVWSIIYYSDFDKDNDFVFLRELVKNVSDIIKTIETEKEIIKQKDCKINEL